MKTKIWSKLDGKGTNYMAKDICAMYLTLKYFWILLETRIL